MGLITRLAARAIQELARNPEARAKLSQSVKVTSKKFNEEVKPRAKRAWQLAVLAVLAVLAGLLAVLACLLAG